MNPSYLTIPPYDKGKRKESFEKVLDILLTESGQQWSTLVELGMTRNDNLSDGHSTPLLAYIALKTQSQLYSVDTYIGSLEVTEKLLRGYGLYDPGKIHLILGDARSFLEQFSGPAIDFLYMDAWSYEPEEREKTEKEALLSFMVAEDWFVKDSLILIDDVLDPKTYDGKGRLVIPYAINEGYKCLHSGYQFLFVKA